MFIFSKSVNKLVRISYVGQQLFTIFKMNSLIEILSKCKRMYVLTALQST